jgi:hypothetical protein
MTKPEPIRPPIAPLNTESTRLFIPLPPVPWYRVPVPPAPAAPLPVVAEPAPLPLPILTMKMDPTRRKPAPVVLAEPATVTSGMRARALFGLGWHPKRIARFLNSRYPPPAVSGLIHVCRSHWTEGGVKALLLQTQNPGRASGLGVTYTTRG